MRMWLVLVGLVGLSIGCGPRTGVVSGEVTYNGQAVPGGILTFRPAAEGANSVPYVLERDGMFRVELPVGEVRVCIDNQEFAPRPAVTAPRLPGMNLPPDVMQGLQEGARSSSIPSDRWVKIPEKYYQLETSDIQLMVQGGEQVLNIELKD